MGWVGSDSYFGVGSNSSHVWLKKLDWIDSNSFLRLDGGIGWEGWRQTSQCCYTVSWAPHVIVMLLSSSPSSSQGSPPAGRTCAPPAGPAAAPHATSSSGPRADAARQPLPPRPTPPAVAAADPLAGSARAAAPAGGSARSAAGSGGFARAEAAAPSGTPSAPVAGGEAGGAGHRGGRGGAARW